MSWSLRVKKIIFLAVLAAFTCKAARCSGGFFTDGPVDKKAIALTIDDGPSTATQKILELLENYGVKATFFMLGSNIERYPGQTQSISKREHEIGNHTWNHINFYKYKSDDKDKRLIREVESTSEIIVKITGRKPGVLRMPYGISDKWARDMADSLDMPLVNWSFGCDWKALDYEQMFEAYKKAVKPGAVLLFHDKSNRIEMRLRVIENIIKYAKEEGYQFLTVSQMFELEK